MPIARTLHQGTLEVREFLCAPGSGTRAVTEQHRGWSVSYVRRGSFACTCRGRHFTLVPGALLIGRPGEEFVCSHDHHDGGDECLAFYFTESQVDELRGRAPAWQAGAMPPVAELVGYGELAQAAVAGRADVSLDEAGLALASRFVDVLAGARRDAVRAGAAEQRRVVDSALWIDACSAEPIGLPDMARQAGWSPYHYLRVFGAVLGVSPHQYLLRSRLRRAARLLADADRRITDIAFEVGFGDLSNFVRSFRRATGVSPRGFRAAARGQRKILQERLDGPA